MKQRLAQIERQLSAIDRTIQERIDSDAELEQKAKVLTSIPGIASVSAAGLIAELPELGQIDGKAIASLTGLASMPRQSGQWKGQSFIRGGRARPRRILHMATLSAIRNNPDLARKCQDLREKGKPAKVALTAVMRKLIVLANALVKQNRPWTPAVPAAST